MGGEGRAAGGEGRAVGGEGRAVRGETSAKAEQLCLNELFAELHPS